MALFKNIKLGSYKKMFSFFKKKIVDKNVETSEKIETKVIRFVASADDINGELAVVWASFPSELDDTFFLG